MNRVVCLILTFGATMLASSEPTSPKPTYDLRPSVKSPRTYPFVVHRKWTAIPFSDRNGNQDHIIEGKVSFGSGVQTVSITRFEGKAGKNPFGLAAQLAAFKKPMLRLRLRRLSPPQGATEPWDVDSDSGTMWGQMMVMKALGEYEVGPFDPVIPLRPVSVGDTWNGRVQISDEQLAMGYNKGQSNQDPRRGVCVYRLRSVDPKKRLATISFRVAGTVSSIDSWNHLPIKRSVVESGEWVLDIHHGVPIRFKADKKAVWSSGLKSEEGTEITHTTMALR